MLRRSLIESTSPRAGHRRHGPGRTGRKRDHDKEQAVHAPPDHPRVAVALTGVAVTTAALLAVGAAGAAPTGGGYGTQEVDQTLLVPSTLDSSFAPFDCRMAPTGPVCTGERHLDEDWVQVDDFGCEVPLFDKFVDDRYSTRYYDHDNLNYFRQSPDQLGRPPGPRPVRSGNGSDHHPCEVHRGLRRPR